VTAGVNILSLNQDNKSALFFVRAKKDIVLRDPVARDFPHRIWMLRNVKEDETLNPVNV
jgi:hypothetical protein